MAEIVARLNSVRSAISTREMGPYELGERRERVGETADPQAGGPRGGRGERGGVATVDEDQPWTTELHAGRGIIVHVLAKAESVG